MQEKVKHYRIWLIVLTVGFPLIAYLTAALADAVSDDPSGLEYLVVFAYLVIALPVSLLIGGITWLTTRKSPKHQLHTLIGFGIIPGLWILSFIPGIVDLLLSN